MAKKVLILSSSPRRGGNSDTLCDEFMRGAMESGNEVEKIFLRDKIINYCTGCSTCSRYNKPCPQKDDTAEIGRKFEKLTTVDGVSIVKLVDKENGGHGSTINKGIELATGRYVKIMDGDDTVDSVEFSKLIDILEYEDADIVLNDYMKDYEQTNTTEVVYNYKFMAPGVKYHFDDLCWEGYGFGEWGPILAAVHIKQKC